MLSLDDESFMQDGVLGEDDDDSFVNFLEYIDETIQNAKKKKNPFPIVPPWHLPQTRLLTTRPTLERILLRKY